MAIFGKKLKTAEEVLEAIKGLSEEEQEKLMAAINGADDEPVADDKPEEEVVADENAEDKPVADEVVDEEVKPEDGEEVVDETADIVEEEPVAPVEETDDKYADLLGRLEALEAKFEALQHKPVEADEDVAHKLDKLASRFGG